MSPVVPRSSRFTGWMAAEGPRYAIRPAARVGSVGTREEGITARGALLFTTNRCSSSNTMSRSMGTGGIWVGVSPAFRSTESMSPAWSTALVNTRRPLQVRPVSTRLRRLTQPVESPSSLRRRERTVRPLCSEDTVRVSRAITVLLCAQHINYTMKNCLFQ